MLTCLLKRVLPFTLTFILGAALGGFVKLFGARTGVTKERVSPAIGSFGGGYGGGHGCKYRRNLLAVSKPLVVREQPSAVYSAEAERSGFSGTVRLRVTFGADGLVKKVERVKGLPYGLTEAAEAAAWRIKFTPATENGLPISVTRVVEYDFPSEQTEDEF